MERYSDPQHAPVPPLMHPRDGYNYYTSIGEEIWDTQTNPANVSKSFDGNDTSFMEPIRFGELMLSTR